LILSQSGNTYFSQRTIQISLDENAEFDQLKISGTLEDTDYVKVYDIKVKKEVPPIIPIPPGIPGYDVLLLLGIVSTIVVIIVKKRLNHLN